MTTTDITLRLPTPTPPADSAVTLLHVIGEAVRERTGGPQLARFRRYSSPAFTAQLLDHMHRAKRTALAEPEGGVPA